MKKLYTFWVETPPLRGMSPHSFYDAEEAMTFLIEALNARRLVRSVTVEDRSWEVDPVHPETT